MHKGNSSVLYHNYRSLDHMHKMLKVLVNHSGGPKQHIVKLHWNYEKNMTPKFMFEKVRNRMDTLLRWQVDDKRRCKNRKAA